MAKRADADLSGLNTDFVISQAKPENRGHGRAVKAYDPSVAETDMETDGLPKPAPTPPTPPVAEPEPEAEPQREVREPSKRKRQQAAGYKDTFLKRNEMKKRQCVYIGYETHALIAKLVRALVSAGNEISVGGYIDTVLTEHLQANRDEINEVYRQQQGDLL